MDYNYIKKNKGQTNPATEKELMQYWITETSKFQGTQSYIRNAAVQRRIFPQAPHKNYLSNI